LACPACFMLKKLLACRCWSALIWPAKRSTSCCASAAVLSAWLAALCR
jgi:hypothetical protein